MTNAHVVVERNINIVTEGKSLTLSMGGLTLLRPK